MDADDLDFTTDTLTTSNALATDTLDCTTDTPTTSNALATDTISRLLEYQNPCTIVTESPAQSQGVSEASLVSSGGTPTGWVLEREVGTRLAVFWGAEKATFEGSVVKCEDELILVHYPCDNKKKWHDFHKDECSVKKILEPAAHTLATLRRTSEGYDAQVDPTGRWYAMSRDYISTTILRAWERARGYYRSLNRKPSNRSPLAPSVAETRPSR